MSRTKGSINEIQEMLKDEDKQLHNATGALARLFKIMLKDLKVNDYSTYCKLMDDWVSNPKYGIEQTSSAISTEKSNLNKEIMSDNMSIQTFLKAIGFLGYDQVELFVIPSKSTEPGKATMTHGIKIGNIPGYISNYRGKRQVKEVKEAKVPRVKKAKETPKTE